MRPMLFLFGIRNGIFFLLVVKFWLIGLVVNGEFQTLYIHGFFFKGIIVNYHKKLKRFFLETNAAWICVQKVYFHFYDC